MALLKLCHFFVLGVLIKVFEPGRFRIVDHFENVEEGAGFQLWNLFIVKFHFFNFESFTRVPEPLI